MFCKEKKHTFFDDLGTMAGKNGIKYDIVWYDIMPWFSKKWGWGD